MGWKATQTPSYVQAQQDMIDDLFKKNYELKKENEKLKKENVELMERVNEIDNDVIRDLNDEVLVLKNDYAVLRAKHQIVQNMYFPNEVPYEWEAKPEIFTNEVKKFEECKITGYKVPKEKSWEEVASDLALRVAKLEEQLKYTQKIICPE